MTYIKDCGNCEGSGYRPVNYAEASGAKDHSRCPVCNGEGTVEVPDELDPDRRDGDAASAVDTSLDRAVDEHTAIDRAVDHAHRGYRLALWQLTETVTKKVREIKEALR